MCPEFLGSSGTRGEGDTPIFDLTGCAAQQDVL